MCSLIHHKYKKKIFNSKKSSFVFCCIILCIISCLDNSSEGNVQAEIATMVEFKSTVDKAVKENVLPATVMEALIDTNYEGECFKEIFSCLLLNK